MVKNLLFKNKRKSIRHDRIRMYLFNYLSLYTSAIRFLGGVPVRQRASDHSAVEANVALSRSQPRELRFASAHTTCSTCVLVSVERSSTG